MSCKEKDSNQLKVQKKNNYGTQSNSQDCTASGINLLHSVFPLKMGQLFSNAENDVFPKVAR